MARPGEPVLGFPGSRYSGSGAHSPPARLGWECRSACHPPPSAPAEVSRGSEDPSPLHDLTNKKRREVVRSPVHAISEKRELQSTNGMPVQVKAADTHSWLCGGDGTTGTEIGFHQ